MEAGRRQARVSSEKHGPREPVSQASGSFVETQMWAASGRPYWLPVS